MDSNDKDEIKKNIANIDLKEEDSESEEQLSSNTNNSIAFKSPTYYERTLKNPGITHFSRESFFIYDNYIAKEYLNKIQNKNLLKLNAKETSFIKNFIKDASYKEGLHNNHKYIFLDANLANDLFCFFKKPEFTSDLDIFLQNEYENESNRANFTCRKLARKCKELKIKAGKTTINKHIRNYLGLKYRKTTVKTNKINTNVNKLISFALIKIIARCLMQKFSIIYCDESGIQTVNSNFKIWRKPDEQFVSEVADKKRLNLILAVNEEGVVYYELSEANTTAKTFLEYMQNLVKVIKAKGIWPYIIVLDNLSCHKTKELFDFYIANKVNVLFNTPYMSIFNAVEIAFRNLKQEIYAKVFPSKEKLVKGVKKILKSKKFNESIFYNLKSTLKEYLAFEDKESTLNLNLIAYE